MRICLVVIMTLFLVGVGAYAHPHVFVTPQAEFIINNRAVSEIRVDWIFDAFNSAYYLETSEANSDEIWKLVFPKTQFHADGRQTFRNNYYTHVEIDGLDIGNISPADFLPKFVDGQLHCRFTLPLNQPIQHSMRVWFLDNSANIYFDLKPEHFFVSGQQAKCYVLEAQKVEGLEIDQVDVEVE